eukprot:COSAG01_NODE_10_length_42970_cov_93.010007_18_plen_64_part_00
MNAVSCLAVRRLVLPVLPATTLRLRGWLLKLRAMRGRRAAAAAGPPSVPQAGAAIGRFPLVGL